MINFIIDKNKVYPIDKNSLVFSELKDYVFGYEDILIALENDVDLTICVHEPIIEKWMRNMALRYSQGEFVFQIMDARKCLAQRWNIFIPDHIRNEEIIEADLLKEEITPRIGDIFENVILENFYNPVYTYSVFPIEKIVDLLLSYDEPIWRRNSAKHLIYRVYQEQLDRWKNKSKDRAMKTIINMIEEDISILKIELMRYKILRTYKDLGEKLLGKNFRVFESLKLNLYDLKIDESKISETIKEIEYYLNDLEISKSPGGVTNFIHGLSGLLEKEFDKIYSFLNKNPELISPKVVGDLKSVFAPIIKKITKGLNKIKFLIKPTIPDTPSLAWSYKEMIGWAIETYFPFFIWADLNGRIDEELIEISDQFAKWLYSHWEELRANSKHLIFNILPNNSEFFQDKNILNLVVIIDNFGWRYIDILKDSFKNINFTAIKMDPYLSMIPSYTELSKKCLLAGTTAYKEIDNKQYSAIVGKGWVPYFNNANFQYLPNLDELLILSRITHQTYVVNYLAIDKALHQSENELGIPHEDHIKALLKVLIEDKIEEFLNKHNLEDKIFIHIVSDHGSTKIPTGLNNDIDLTLFKEKDFTKISDRCVAVTTKKFTELPDNLKGDCFFIEQGRFGSDRHYLCARRANHFSNAIKNCYTHGGITPEEVIVPHIIFQKILSSIKEIELKLLKTLYRYKLENIELEITNPNKYSVTNIVVKINTPNIDSESYHIDFIDGKRKTSFSIQGRFARPLNSSDIKNLNFIVSFECNGKPYRNIEITLPIKMKSMFTLKDQTIFDDLE